MQKRKLGNTGIEISEIAFGGVEIGIPYGIGINSKEDMLSEAKAIELLNCALDSGINFFDTARMYGESENIIGKAFKSRRKEVIIATKCRHLLDNEGNLPTDSMLKDVIRKSLYESLEALQTDYVDIFMLHQANIKILENETISNVFSEFKSKGLFKAMGVSTYTSDETGKAIEAGCWNMVQLPFNLMDQRQEHLFKKANDKGVGIVVRSVILKGLLSNRSENLHPALKDVEEHIKKYYELLKETTFSLPAFATKFALSFPEVSSVLVGIDKKDYLDQALKTADGNYFNDELFRKAKDLAYPNPKFINLPYWNKMNWLK
jgi:aryl-alcohol dehydrogenase-like predicted oxidoreductase